MDELIYASAVTIARNIRDKKVSAAEVVDAHLQRIDEVNPTLNAVVQSAADRARAEAREADAALARGEVKGPLHGVPMTIKDSLDSEGVISTGGTKGRASFVPDADSTVVARLRSAGAILLGKTNTPELTLAGETDNLIYGPTNNPYDLTRTPGGSSGGAQARSSPRAALRWIWAATRAGAFASPPTSAASPASSPTRAEFPAPATSYPTPSARWTR